jgi:hypothetical protein
MMHKKNFVAAIKVDGKVLRESSDRVELPFGSEYSVLLKNLDTVKMQVQVSIDGKDASGWLVIDPSRSLDLERFYRGNHNSGNKFKFIERTTKIEQHRGIDAEDGLIRVEFKREKVYESSKFIYSYPHIWNTGFNSHLIQTPSSGISGSTTRFTGMRSGIGAHWVKSSQGANGGMLTAGSVQNMQIAKQSVQNEAGITVEGGISNQKFISVSGFECEAPEAIVLHLVGRSGTQPVRVAKTVSLKPVCHTCGKKNKAATKFCTECGTSLQKV